MEKLFESYKIIDEVHKKKQALGMGAKNENRTKKYFPDDSDDDWLLELQLLLFN